MNKMMKRTLGTISLGLAALLLSNGIAAAEDKPEADLTVGIYSKYVWRGFALSDDNMVIQPSMTVGYKGFAFNLWGNLDTDNTAADSQEFNETDMTISYDGSAGKLGYSLGYIYYAIEGTDTQEVYAGVSIDTILSPALTVYKDFDTFPSYYILLAVSHSFEIAKDISLDLGAHAGYLLSDDEADYADSTGGKYSDLLDGLISASVTIPLGEYVTVTPQVYYSMALSSEAETLLQDSDGDDSFIYGGISASFAF
ncbi:MAG: hypothetical protein KKE17_03580 [Proteobacteria bacterium]|nr:hypothetical protein [Pseudomonadota bacterium]MBU1709065.1 hypothetical protein [Pseudomonadota bacterium]